MKNSVELHPEHSTRRSFYSALIASLGSLLGIALGLPAVAYLFGSLPSRKEKDRLVKAADLAQLAINKPQRLTFERTRVDGWRKFEEKAVAWVVRTGAEKVVAYSPQCTHLGCAYHWKDEGKEFACPCHASRFSMDGRVLGGPAARPLDRYVVCIEKDQVLIGSRILKA